MHEFLQLIPKYKIWIFEILIQKIYDIDENNRPRTPISGAH